MKKFCESLTEHAMKIINYEEKKKMNSKTQIKTQKFVIFVKKNLKICGKKKNQKVRDHYHYTQE